MTSCLLGFCKAIHLCNRFICVLWVRSAHEINLSLSLLGTLKVPVLPRYLFGSTSSVYFSSLLLVADSKESPNYSKQNCANSQAMRRNIGWESLKLQLDKKLPVRPGSKNCKRQPRTL